MTRSNKDQYWMKRALVLAKRGLGRTYPNPVVGAIVLDENGICVGEGFHQKAGEPHAEVIALKSAGDRAGNGTLYVTLEPCTHTGKTPPCVEAIVAHGIKRVVVATLDPNPVVDGHGVSSLRSKEVNVDVGCMKDTARQLNLPFEKWIQKKESFVTAKVAMSLDGRIGIRSKRLFLSDPLLKRTTMRLRAEAQAIVVGVGTVLTDDPRLNLREFFEDRKPDRVIVDENLATPPTSKVFESSDSTVWILSAKKSQKSRTSAARNLEKAGARIVYLDLNEDGKLDITAISDFFRQQNWVSILIEGGGALLSRFQRANRIDRWVIYLTPHVLGEVQDGQPTVSVDLGAPFSLKYHSVIRRGMDCEIWATPS